SSRALVNQSGHSPDGAPMSILDIIKAVAKNGGIDEPTVAVASTDREMLLAVQFCQEAAEEIRRRADFDASKDVTTIAGTGAAQVYTLPASFFRLQQSKAVRVASGRFVSGVSRSEFEYLEPIQGLPRLFYLSGKTIQFWPYPAIGTNIRVHYIRDAVALDAVGNPLPRWTADSNTAICDENLIILGATWRWKRHLGMPFEDYAQEFEAALAVRATDSDGMRVTM
ncbi:MAG: hypothetical protein ACRCU5_00220, partial [Rhizobiaceae bacterium]